MENRILIVGLSLLATTALAQHTFDHYEWDFGSIEESEGTVSHTFMLRNEGTGPLYITRAIPSCTCITAQLPQEAIMPGKAGELVVSFSPSGSVGETFRSVELTDQEGRLICTLNVRADVNPIDRSIQERYYYTLGDMLYANRVQIPFGYVYPDDTPSKTLFLANASKETMSIEKHYSSEWLQVQCPDSILPGEELPLTLSYPFPEDASLIATLKDTVRLQINGKEALLPITTSAICLQRLGNSDEVPSLRTYPSSGRLLPKEDFLEAEIEIHNDGKGQLKVLKIEAPESSDVQIGQTAILPGEQTLLRVTYKKRDKHRIGLFTNDPKRPYRDIEIK